MSKERISEILRQYNAPEGLRVAIFEALSEPEVGNSLGTEKNETLPFAFEGVNLHGLQEEGPKESLQTKIGFSHKGRFDNLHVLGAGGMGEVRLVRDRELNRKLAMKVIHPHLLQKEAVVARFIEEGQVCAQLQHPNIVPVHEIGRLEDGRLYFTMKEIKGRPFGEAIEEVHKAILNDRWQTTASGWSFRKLIDAFYQVCQAVSYAHSKGVLHRDLKPENIMLGEYGEVLVVDWGIAKVLGRRDYAAEFGELDVVQTDRSEDKALATRMGMVAGTPTYMPPEQARGEIDRLDGRSDIYSLGAILYEILTGSPPYIGNSGRQILRQVISGPPTSIRSLQASATQTLSFGLFDEVGVEEEEQYEGPPLPDELVDACERAMSRKREERFPSVLEFSQIISDWLDGAKKREQALEVVGEGLRLDNACQQKRAKAKELFQHSKKGLQNIPSWEKEGVKGPWWDLEKEAEELERDADLLQTLQEQKFQAALTHKSDLAEAHLALAKQYHKEHLFFENHREENERIKAEVKLKEHVYALPNSDPEKEKLLTYLKGRGAFSLDFDTDGVEVILEQFVPHYKRLIPKPIANLGRGAIKDYPLEMGSYRVRLRKDEHQEVLYPISIGRGEHWSCQEPSGKIKSIHLPKIGEISEEECFIPAGWFWAGGDPSAETAFPRRRIWVDDFVIQKYPVTNRQYIDFLNDLVRQGKEEDALLYVPREVAGHHDELGSMIYGRTKEGLFQLVPDTDGDLWKLDWPVLMMSWISSMAYAGWKSEKEGKPWRLLHELEWEKAARGVDGRFFPWGDEVDPSYSCMSESHQGILLPKNVFTSFPIDESVYGVRGTAGNSRDWCLNKYVDDWDLMSELETISSDKAKLSVVLASLANLSLNSRRVLRGGDWGASERELRLANRKMMRIRFRSGDIGFRLGYSFSQITP